MGGEAFPHSRLILPPTPESASVARQEVGQAVAAWGVGGLATDAELVVSELVTNAVLHARTEVQVAVAPISAGIRIEVTDGSPTPVRPHVLAPPPDTGPSLLSGDSDLDAIEELLSAGGTTGRGLQLVANLASAWGCSVLANGVGKVVWADLVLAGPGPAVAGPGSDVIGPTRPETDVGAAVGITHPVRLVAVPVRLALESDLNLETIVREFHMVHLTGAAPRRSTDLLGSLTANRDRYRGVEAGMHATLRAAVERGDRLTDFVMLVPLSALTAMRRTNDVLDQLATYCHRGDLLALAPSGELRAFRRWWVDEIGRQMGGQRPEACPFSTSAPEADIGAGPSELPAAARTELDRIGAALDRATEAPDVVEILLTESLRSLGASTASLSLRVPDSDAVEIADSIGLEASVAEHWRLSGMADDLPASEAIRTGRPIVVRTPAELDVRYPGFRGTPLQPDVSFASVPLRAPGGPPAGALNISFSRSRDFSPADLRIVADLCAMAATALERVGAGSRQAGRQERQDVLDRVSAALAEDPGGPLEDRLRTVVQVAGGWFEGWVSAFVKGPDGRPVRVAGGHRDAGQSQLMADLEDRWPPQHAADAVVRCLTEGETIVFQSVPDQLLAQIARDPDHLEAMRRLRISSVVAVPVCEGREVAGVVAVSNPPGRYVTDAEIRIVQEIAGRTGR